MGSKKSKAPAPDYKAMANRLATWQHEDATWHKDRLKEAANIHNREMGRAKARYAASGGSKDKIGEIEAEHKRKWEATEADINKKYKEKQQTLRTGTTYKELFGRFTATIGHEMGQEAERRQTAADKVAAPRAGYTMDYDSPYYKSPPQKDTSVRDAYLKEQGAQMYANGRTQFAPGSEAISEANFIKWAKTFGDFKTPEDTPQEDVEQIKTRKGEKPRAPLMADQLEQNPWIG